MDIGSFRRREDDDAESWDSWLKSVEPSDSDAPEDIAENPQPRSHHQVRKQSKSTQAVDSFTSPVDQAPREHRTEKRASSGGFGAEREGQRTEPAVSIQISLPDFHLPHPNIPWRAVRLWGMGLAVVCAVLVGGKYLVDHMKRPAPKAPELPKSVQAVAGLGYKPVVPPARPASEGQPSSPRYDSQKQLYSFNDTYKGSNLTIDQQAIPENLKASADAVKKLAESIGATQRFTTTAGTAYIGTSENSGSQRLVVANDKMLMFIQSTKKIDNADWVTYIQDLQ